MRRFDGLHTLRYGAMEYAFRDVFTLFCWYPETDEDDDAEAWEHVQQRLARVKTALEANGIAYATKAELDLDAYLAAIRVFKPDVEQVTVIAVAQPSRVETEHDLTDLYNEVFIPCYTVRRLSGDEQPKQNDPYAEFPFKIPSPWGFNIFQERQGAPDMDDQPWVLKLREAEDLFVRSCLPKDADQDIVKEFCEKFEDFWLQKELTTEAQQLVREEIRIDEDAFWRGSYEEHFGFDTYHVSRDEWLYKVGYHACFAAVMAKDDVVDAFIALLGFIAQAPGGLNPDDPKTWIVYVKSD